MVSINFIMADVSTGDPAHPWATSMVVGDGVIGRNMLETWFAGGRVQQR